MVLSNLCGRMPYKFHRQISSYTPSQSIQRLCSANEACSLNDRSCIVSYIPVGTFSTERNSRKQSLAIRAMVGLSIYPCFLLKPCMNCDSADLTLTTYKLSYLPKTLAAQQPSRKTPKPQAANPKSSTPKPKTNTPNSLPKAQAQMLKSDSEPHKP